jgi:hypothetical protein
MLEALDPERWSVPELPDAPVDFLDFDGRP